MPYKQEKIGRAQSGKAGRWSLFPQPSGVFRITFYCTAAPLRLQEVQHKHRLQIWAIYFLYLPALRLSLVLSIDALHLILKLFLY